MKTTKWKILITLNNVLFLTIYFILLYNNRLTQDDFYYKYLAQEYGVIEGVIYQYQNWCTRYFGIFFNLLVFSIPSEILRNVLFNTLLLAVYLIGIFRLISLSKYFQSQSLFWRTNFSILILSGFFYASINIGEVWYWLAASTSYTLGVGLLLLGLSFVLSEKINFYYNGLIFIVFLLIGGLNEILSLSFIGMGIISLVFVKKKSISQNKRIKLTLAILSCSIALYLLIIGEGNEIRGKSFESISILEAFFLNFKMSSILLIKYVIPNLLILLLWSVVVVICLPRNLMDRMKMGTKKVLFSVLFLILFIFFYQFPITYKTQDIGAVRTVFPIFYIIVLFLIHLIVQLEIRKKFAIKVRAFALLLFTSIQMYWLVDQWITTSAYAYAYDIRMEKINEAKDSDTTIKLQKLPNSGWLHSAEISTDTNAFPNRHLKLGLNLKCKLLLEE